MKVKYETTLKVTVIHDIDTIENLKDNNEFANDLAQMICDEATTAGSVACYEIIESKIDVNVKEIENAERENIIYNDFIKNSRR